MNDNPRRGGGRHRPPPQLVEVVRVDRVTPRLVSVHLGGADLSRFQAAAPTSHIKVFLPAPGQDAPAMPTVTPEGRVWPEGVARPAMRTYTPRAYDAVAGTLEVQFVLHGEGPASEWAARAKPGDRIALGGPGGRFAADLDAPRWWIAGDESALPAIGSLLDALPASASAHVHVEAAGPNDEIPLLSKAGLTVTWHHRPGTDGFGDGLHAAAERAPITGATRFWVACEASAMRRIRRTLLDRGAAPSALITRGYWRLGAADHPDHDYGDD
ncbi:siderophore-interacting protein [Actinoplanes capillaceus]|uniref:Siderophore-interacting protein n=1 Tax=Actinoplanes campanulatus TaxID=113559 RepID=A0ABQ3W776_9ACTN|nr:siderophore-interacting protein [Actinoplanes capillaceus]GID42832.1 siderophore-interacting protein [Actinoplanes capillaceus]